jgi:PKD repeat protein
MKKIITLLLIILSAFSLTTTAQTGTACNADFTFQFTTANTVKFTPVVIGDSINTFHQWSFGDGITAAIALPTHTYTANGVYTVKHIVYKINPNGIQVCRDTVTKQIIIQQVVCNLQAYFTWRIDSLHWQNVIFQNQTLPTEAADSIRWNFGDGSPTVSGVVGTLSTPSHVYANAGTYNVCIRVKKNNTTSGTPCVSEICKTVIVAQPCNLIANFSFASTATNPLTIAFLNLSIPLSATDSIRWTFGDGSTSTDISPTHTFAQAGTYTVCLRVKKSNTIAGTIPCVSEICKTVIVQSPCNIQIGFTMHRDSVNPRKVYFNNTTIAPTISATAKWSFGDGTYAGTWNAVHEYALPGTYRVCLTIQTAPNCIKEKCDTVVIPPPAPSCQDISKFKFEKFSNDNQKYKFTPDYVSNDIVYTWTFGDGTGSHDAVATHRYAQPGVYTVCLTAWRGPNCASTTCKEIRVLPQVNCDSIRVTYTYQRDPFIPNKIYFYVNANFPVLDQTWTITKLTPSTTTPVILHQNNPSYVFGDTGTYRVCLKAITLGGCVKEFCSVIRIERLAPVCILQAYPNPASSVINVAVSLPQPLLIKAYVYNSVNVLVKEKQQQGAAGNNVVTINVNDLAPGAYTIKVLYGNSTCYARFTKL